MTPRLILGTAGHIDHGKTTLVRALTGTDTDRLREEKERGITIELGFAELVMEGGPSFGVVDVPGHEAFVRAMVAGAAGMDVVLLVVAADEGIMPQTREHLAIVELLGVPRLVVALTKCDLVEEEWLELVEAEVAETLETTPYDGAAMVRTAATVDTGVDALVEELRTAGGESKAERSGDLTRLPLDRVFTIRGTGTVVTGTLWSGRLRPDQRVRVLPQELEARIRSLQVHGRDAQAADAGARTAVALVGDGADREVVARGATLVGEAAWSATWMLTTHVRMLDDTGWSLEHNQRVHVHLGTAEVLARVALLEDAPLRPGEDGWVQLRLEEPLVARGRDRFVMRAYSPVTTIGGGTVAESHPPKRTRISTDERRLLTALLRDDAAAAVGAALALAGWTGVGRQELPVRTGLHPRRVDEVVDTLLYRDRAGTQEAPGFDASPHGAMGRCVEAGGRVFGDEVVAEARDAVLTAVDAAHEADALLAAIPASTARSGLPSWAASELADAVLVALVDEGRLEVVGGGVRRPGHVVRLSPDQEEASERIMGVLREGGIAAPFVEAFPDDLVARSDFRALLRRLHESQAVQQVAEDLFVVADELDAAAVRIRSTLAGGTDLGPADFREVLPVTRKHLIPLLNYFDGLGVTLRTPAGRDVAPD